MKKNYIAPDTILKKVSAVSIMAGSPGTIIDRTEDVYAEEGEEVLSRENGYDLPSYSVWND